MWLWHEVDYVHFDEGYRVEGHREFKDPQQFKNEVAHLAERAATEIRVQRSRFATISGVSEFYGSLPGALPFWRSFDAGVALGIVGRSREAAHHFANVTPGASEAPEWALAGAALAKSLCRDLSAPERFMERVSGMVARTRALLDLSPLGSLSWTNT
jgi:hypothetical protein